MNIRHTAPRPRLILYKAFALSSLVLATTLLSCPSARAGTWQFTCTGSGTNTLNFGYPGMFPRITHWTPPGPQTGRFDLGSTLGDSSDYAVSDVATLTVTVTATWTHGTGQDNTSDPAPSKVWLCESAQANWSEGQSGSAADGLSDPYQAQVPGPGGASSSDTAPVATPPTHWTLKTVSGGTVTLPARTLTAEADFSPTTNRPYGNFCTAHIASYSVTVHPQPYDFSQIEVIDNGNGTLSFTYWWLSTDGQLSHIGSGCVVHEFVTYDGPNPFPLPAPFVGSLKNPTVLPDPPQPGSAGVIYDNQLMPSTAKPYQSASVISTQKWEYDDSATGEKDVVVPGPDSGPLSITRTIGVRPPYTPYWWYSVTKNGSTAWAPLPSQ